MQDQPEQPESSEPIDTRNNPSEPSGYPLATRMQRMYAAVLDDSIALLTLLPLFSYYDLPSKFEAGLNIPFEIIVNLNLFAFVMFLLVHGYLLYNYGQTLGKRVMGIAIATMDFQVPEFNRLIALRYVPFRIAGLIPGFNLIPIVDVLYIFRQDKRCLHDLLARTQVISIRAPHQSQ